MLRKASFLCSKSSLEGYLHPFLPATRTPTAAESPTSTPCLVLCSESEGSPSTFSQHLAQPVPSPRPLRHPPGQPVTDSLVSSPSLPFSWLPPSFRDPEELAEGDGKVCVCGGVCSLAGAGGDNRVKGRQWRGHSSPPRGAWPWSNSGGFSGRKNSLMMAAEASASDGAPQMRMLLPPPPRGDT